MLQSILSEEKKLCVLLTEVPLEWYDLPCWESKRGRAGEKRGVEGEREGREG